MTRERVCGFLFFFQKVQLLASLYFGYISHSVTSEISRESAQFNLSFIFGCCGILLRLKGGKMWRDLRKTVLICIKLS